IKNEQRFLAGFAGKIRREFNALRFAAGKSGCGLPESQISKADLFEYFEFFYYFRNISEEQQSLTNGHVQDLINVFAFVEDLEDAALVSCSLTLLAHEFDIGQELHLNGDGSIALADLASAARDVERETSRVVSPGLRLACCSKNVPDVIEGFDVG